MNGPWGLNEKPQKPFEIRFGKIKTKSVTDAVIKLKRYNLEKEVSIVIEVNLIQVKE